MIDNDAFILPTIYKGIKYRSRTEARWARFFHAAGIKFFYESEAFALPSGNYLPDFKIFPYGWKCDPIYAEVKGQYFSESEKKKCFDLCALTKCPVIMLDGPPDFKEYYIFELGKNLRRKIESCCDTEHLKFEEIYETYYASEPTLTSGLFCTSNSKYAPFYYGAGFGGNYPYFNSEDSSLEIIDPNYKPCIYAAQNERFGT